jgi:hypothetical protein
MTEDSLPLAELLAKAGDGDFLRSVAEAARVSTWASTRRHTLLRDNQPEKRRLESQHIGDRKLCPECSGPGDPCSQAQPRGWLDPPQRPWRSRWIQAVVATPWEERWDGRSSPIRACVAE